MRRRPFRPGAVDFLADRTRRGSGSASRWGVWAVTALMAGFVAPVGAQETRQVPGDSVEAVSPSGAFLRGALIPGWGHASSGSLTRGAFYFGVEAAAGWMIYKTARRLSWAQEEQAFWEMHVTERLAREGITDPEELLASLDEDSEVLRARGLVEAREEQREDWLAAGIFFLLLSGVDAFVSAHLKDFPEALTVEGDPTTGSLEVGVSLPLPAPFGGR